MKDAILQTLSQINRPGIIKLMDYLRDSDFFTAPASAKNHLSEKGGLARHSWNTFLNLEKISNERFVFYSMETCAICGLLHDVCKVNRYEYSGGEWRTKKNAPHGHGKISVERLAQFIELHPHEAAAIRWHMGAWDAKRNQLETLNREIKFNKLLPALMIADQLATYFDDTRLTQ